MAIEKVRDYLKNFGMEARIIEFPTSSATVDLAAKAAGVIPARICKTLSFKTDDGCVLIQTAGDAKVSNSKYKANFKCKAKMLSPEEVLFYTGHEIGGVCAFGIERDDVRAYCDNSMIRFETMFPACGSSNSAIELTTDELFRYSNSLAWIDVCDIPEIK